VPIIYAMSAGGLAALFLASCCAAATSSLGGVAALAAATAGLGADGPAPPLSDDDACTLLQVPDLTRVALKQSLLQLPSDPGNIVKARHAEVSDGDVSVSFEE